MGVRLVRLGMQKIKKLLDVYRMGEGKLVTLDSAQGDQVSGVSVAVSPFDAAQGDNSGIPQPSLQAVSS